MIFEDFPINFKITSRKYCINFKENSGIKSYKLKYFDEILGKLQENSEKI